MSLQILRTMKWPLLLNVDKSDDYASTAPPPPPNEAVSDYLEPHLGDAHSIPLRDKLDGTQDSSKNGDDDILSDPNVPTNNHIEVLSDPLIFYIFEHEHVSPSPQQTVKKSKMSTQRKRPL
ncbi:hypothetical protein DM860_001026 [Cuscuta australis]|uniref:Uncharacterized protein n=1 Tax=Cuscuta australis TaxID=267555 RepID=A0A328DTM5_9ASTE|nr:hypothetical protein DM860_001026 [Cuscuta australis]